MATFGPALSYELQYRIIQVRGVQFEVPKLSEVSKVSQASQEGFASILAGNKEQILIPQDTYFSISIPKIGASARIFPNIDPANSEEFLSVLQKGIAHAKGSVFPGMPGNVYLFAHSTDNWWNVGRYNAVFYLLQHLKAGDEIIVFFENKRYEYIVSQAMISDANDISLLTQAHGGQERLVLQTCWPPGTTWKRLFVVATPNSLSTN